MKKNKVKPKTRLEMCCDTLDFLATKGLTKQEVIDVMHSIELWFKQGTGLGYEQVYSEIDQRF